MVFVSMLIMIVKILIVCHIVKLLFLLIISAFQDLICSTFWIAFVTMIRVCGEDI